MGKGGCFAALAEQSVECARFICCLAICCVCAGPILFIIGIVFLVSPNNRASNVQKYNDAVNTFFAGDYQAMRSSSFMADGVQMFYTTQSVVINGNKDDVAGNGTSAYFFTNSKAQAANVAGGSSAIISSLRGNANSFVLSYPTSGQVTRNYVCSPPYGYSSCSNIGASDCPSGYRDSYVRTKTSTCNKND
eukprot:PhF_6_TR35361/c1_g1_i3/m.51336